LLPPEKAFYAAFAPHVYHSTWVVLLHTQYHEPSVNVKSFLC
jgi:hypothetical protein